MTRSWIGGAAALGLVLASTLAPAPASAQEADNARGLLLVLDASGSMWGQIGGENKIVIAREVVSDLLATLPDTTAAATSTPPTPQPWRRLSRRLPPRSPSPPGAWSWGRRPMASSWTPR